MARKTAEAPASEKMYRSISEVSELLEVKPHVLRYWETEFRPFARRSRAKVNASTHAATSRSYCASRICCATRGLRSLVRASA